MTEINREAQLYEAIREDLAALRNLPGIKEVSVMPVGWSLEFPRMDNEEIMAAAQITVCTVAGPRPPGYSYDRWDLCAVLHKDGKVTLADNRDSPVWGGGRRVEFTLVNVLADLLFQHREELDAVVRLADAAQAAGDAGCHAQARLTQGLLAVLGGKVDYAQDES